MALLFKVWDITRTRKVFVSVDAAENVYENLILKASEKMQINGCTLVLESDGTIVDDDDVLKLLNNEILIILQPNEVWRLQGSSSHSFSSASTLSICSADFASTSDDVSISSKSDDDEQNRSDNPPSQNTWVTFNIPWHKVNETALKDLEAGKRNRRSTNDIVNTVVDSMRAIKSTIPRKAFKIAADKMVAKYPKSLKDIDDDGTVFGDGNYSIFNKLMDRHKYLSRSHKRFSEENISPIIPPKDKKRMLAAKAGCVNWQPLVTEKLDEEQIKEKLKSVNFDVLDEETLSLLDATYPFQRAFLNKPEPPSIAEVKNEWPILLSKEGIYWHYNKLMSQDINILSGAMLAKADKFIKFGCNKKFISSEPTTEEEKLITVFKIICDFFHENIKTIFFQIWDESDITSLNINSPHIVCLEKDSAKQYFAVVEKTEVYQGTLNDSLQVIFALYYNFNLQYPKEAANTCEMIQRYLLKINPDHGTKNKNPSILKILSFINQLRNF